MNGENINIGSKPLRVLVSPLDWGLGHATRIITIVKILQNYDVQVLIAAETGVSAVLKTEFPQLEILPLRGYRVRYSRSKKNFIFKLLGQIPGMIASIAREHQWLKKVVADHNIDAIISDNRFGFYHTSVPSVYITHQLFIETGNKWMNNLAQKIHYRYINKFTECWVPDFEAGENLAGKLSHPEKMPAVPVKYLGPLSRFNQESTDIITNDLLIILSGPEPQRTIWEKELLRQIKNLNCRIILIRGKPGSDETVLAGNSLTIYNHLSAADLQKLISGSAMIVSRCGYSTVMDLVALSKKAILVPTPGQAEQEYLAVYLKEKHLFYTCSQESLQLLDALTVAGDFPQQKLAVNFNAPLEKIIKEWVNNLRALK